MLIACLLLICHLTTAQETDQRIISHVIDPSKGKLQFYWKDDHGANFGNFEKLKNELAKKGDTLVFAMNGGMYNHDSAPQGLYVEDGHQLAKIDTASNGYGNFYMKPNGIFYLQSDYIAGVCATEDFKPGPHIRYATQSGPMLLIDGKIHHRFMRGSQNVHIRNGVGILPNGNILFAISREKTNFYDFASFFRKKGCKNALYLDGLVSRMYLPSKNWIQLDGSFGVMIGQVK